MSLRDIHARTLLASVCLILVMLTGLGSTPGFAKSAAEIDIMSAHRVFPGNHARRRSIPWPGIG